MTVAGLFRVAALVACVGLASAHVAFSASPIQQLTNDAASDVRPAWSPDGKQIAFQSNRGKLFQVYVGDAEGANERRLSPPDADDRHPAWSPDGSTIAVDSGAETAREIWTIDLASGARTQVTRLGSVASFPSWSPDAKRLSFYAYQGGVLDLWSVGVDGSEPRRLTTNLASEQKSQCTFACHAAPWSPDGTRLAYSTANNSQVWTMLASDGSGAVRISPDGEAGRSHFPLYLPDGRLVYVTEHVTPGRAWTDLWVVRPDGSQPREALLEDVQAQGPFSLSADTQWLLFSSPRGGNFDVYRVALSPEGKEAMKVRSAEAEPAPALAARLAAQATPQATALPTSPVVSPPPIGGEEARTAAASPYLFAIAGLAGLWLAVEGTLRLRRRARQRRAGSSRERGL